MDKKVDFSKEEVKLPYSDLMLEVTRMCNLKCEHCMRGDAQDLYMSDEVLHKALDSMSSCGKIALTGGEPFLAPDVIENMVDYIIDNNLKVYCLSTVDNGTILDNRGIRCIKAFNRLAEYIKTLYKDDEKQDIYVSVSISQSEFHKNDIQKAIDFYKQYANNLVEIQNQGDWDSGLKDKEGNIIKLKDRKGNGWIKKEGRAVNLNVKGSKFDTNTYMVEMYLNEEKNKAYVKSTIQICANGNVCICEPMSFEHMDRNRMGNILNEPVSCMIEKWNWTHLSREEMKLYERNKDKINTPGLPKDKKAEYQILNDYIRIKALFYKYAHADYPYMTKEELGYCVSSKVALEMIYAYEVGMQKKMTEKEEREAINTMLSFEFDGDMKMEDTPTKADLENMIQVTIQHNHERVLKNRGFLGYITYLMELAKKDKAREKELSNIKEEYQPDEE